MKTGGTAPDLCRTPDLYRTLDIRKVLDLYKALNIHKVLDLRKALDIRKILLPLDDRNGTHRVSKVRKDKAGGPVLDAEEVTVSLSTNAKGLRILFSEDLYIYLVKED
jgi:hypothetical protein